MPDCLFCNIVRGEIPCHKVYEDERVLAFLDIQPVNPGHVLVIPKTHSANMVHMAPEDLHAVMDAVQKIAPALLRAVGFEGFNLGVNTGAAAGQVVFHTHFHVMPRRPGDGYELWHGTEAGDLAAMAEKVRGAL
ncbi:HIT family protein [Candidatus Uhrbacteria bacterium]|nr:HIT family protein [Candidatus Uhrbacteria bacterium]